MLTVILTGGASRRMGRDKAMLPSGSTTMALMLAENYKALGPVALSVDRPGRFPAGNYRELADRYPGCGPLNGLVSAFLDTDEDVVFLTATDMPGGDTAAVRELMDALGTYDACIYEREPLFGVYRRSCLDTAQKCLQEGEYAFRKFLRRVNVNVLPLRREEITENLNTPEEYEAYIRRNLK